MAYDFSSLLSMAQAHFVSEAAQPQQKDEQLTVFWENIPPQLLREAREWLVDNRLSVADFTVEHKQYEGTWHLVSLQAGEQVKTGRVQAVFQKGYATSLTWALARLTNAKLAHTNASTAGVADSSSDNPIRYLNVRFPNIDRRAVNSIISGIATTYTDVELSSETYSGEWHVVYATSGLQQEGQKDNDGAAFIEIFLAKPQYTLQTKRNAGTPQERTVWYCWDVPQAIAQSVIDTFEGTGTSVSANNNSAQNLVDLILESSTPESGQRFSLSSVACSQRVYDYVYRSVSNPDAYALPSTSTDGVIYSREEALNDDGTYNVFIKATLSRSRIFEFESFSAPFASESTISYRANTGVIQAPPSGLGGVYRLRQDVNPDCTYDADLTYKAGLNAGEAIFGSERGGLSTEDRAVYRDRTSQVTAPEPGQRGIYQADNQLTEEGLYNSTLQYRTSTARELEFESQATKFRRQSEHVYRNSDTPITAPIPGAGGLYRVEQQINPDLTYDARLVYTSGNSQGQAKFNSQSSELVSEASIIYRDIQSQIDVPSASQGQIYQATNQLTDEGLYNASLQYQVSKPDVAKFRSQATKFRSESTITYRNSRAVIEAPTPSASGMYRVSQRENQDGTYDAELTYSAGTNSGQVGFSSLESALSKEDEVVYRDRSVSISAPNSSQGVINRAANQITDDGLYNSTLQSITSSAASLYALTDATKFRREDTRIYRNSRSVPNPAAPTGSGRVRASFSINQDGTYDAQVSSSTSTGGGSANLTSTDSALVHVDEVVYRDYGSVMSAPASSQGVIGRASTQITDDGLYNGSAETITSNAASASGYTDYTAFRSEKTSVYKNSRTLPEAPSRTGSGRSRASFTINQDGTYDAQVSVSASTGGGADTFKSLYSVLSSSLESVYRERSSSVAALGGGVGVIVRATNQITDDGLYNGSVETISSIPYAASALSDSTAFRKETLSVYRNYTTIPEATLVTGSGRSRASFTVNQDGTFDGQIVKSESTGSGSKEIRSIRSALLYEDTTVYKDAIYAPEAEVQSAGAIQSANISITEEGLYNGSLQTRTSNSAASSFASESSAGSDSSSVVYKNSRSEITASASQQGIIYRAQSSINDDGTYDGQVVVTESTPQSLHASSVSSSVTEGSIHVYSNIRNEISLPSTPYGGVYTLSDYGPNPDGTYSARVQFRKSKNVSIGQSTGGSHTGYEREDVYRGLTELSDISQVDGVIYNVGISIEEDGTYSKRVTANTARVVDSGWIAGKSSYRRFFVNQDFTTAKTIVETSGPYKTSFDISPSQHPNKWNGSISLVPFDNASKGDDSDTGQDYSFALNSEDGLYNVSIKITRNRGIAAGHVSGNAKAHHGGHTAGVFWRGNGYWEAVKITKG